MNKTVLRSKPFSFRSGYPVSSELVNQAFDNLYYDIYKRKRPLDTTELPWYKQKGMALQTGLGKSTLGLVELAASGVDYGFDTNFLTEVQKATKNE